MKFDEVIQPPCEFEVERNPTTCEPADGQGGGDDEPPVVPPSDDERCLDPAFYDANPDICAGFPRLILKPEYAITTPLGHVQYKTYVRTGGDEIEVTSGLTYSVSDTGVGIITEDDGLFTGFAPGIAQVNVAWQNLHAHAQVEVVAACDDISTNFLLLIDNSKSSKVGFSGTYASRLVYAKEAARQFVDSVNFSKDRVGVAFFNTSGSITLVYSDDPVEIKAAIAAIASTDARTNVLAGLQEGFESLDAATGRSVLVVFSDFENNEGDDPVAPAKAWKEAGNVIVVVGLRIWGPYFNLAFKIASGGFFLSSYDATAADNIETLLGLKSYLCSGDCPLPVGEYPMAAINYRAFENWDVIEGQVDLHGLGNGAPDNTAAWDVHPGHGLYVDMIGKTLPDTLGGAASIPEIKAGVIRSKVAFTFENGKDYELRLKVGGQNRNAAHGNFPVRVRIIREDNGDTLLDEEITPSAWNAPFEEFELEFTADADCEAKIQIQMEEQGVHFNGTFIDDIELENVTDTDVMLSDDFNNENLQTIESSYSVYGCLDAPPGAQVADPEPPTPPLEGL